MALLGMKETAAAARWSNVGSLAILRLHEEFVSSGIHTLSDLGSHVSHTPRTRPSSERCADESFGLSLEVIKL